MNAQKGHDKHSRRCSTEALQEGEEVCHQQHDEDEEGEEPEEQRGETRGGEEEEGGSGRDGRGVEEISGEASGIDCS